MRLLRPDPRHASFPFLIIMMTLAAAIGAMVSRFIERLQIDLTGEHLALIGAIASVPLVVALLWTTGRLRKKSEQAHEESPVGKAADSTLHETLERTRLILDSALDAVVGMDMQGNITDWNARAEAMFGWTQKEIVGRKLVESIIPPRYRDAHERGFQRFLASGEGPFLNRRVELAALRRDGTEFPIELTISPLKMGESYVFSSFIADITERKLSEEKLQKSLQVLEQAQQVARLGIWFWDIPTNTVTWSDQLYQLHGLRPGEFSATYEGFLGLVHPEDRDTVRTAIESAYRDGQAYQIEFRVLRPDGTMWWNHSRGEIIRDADGTTIAMIGVAQDITERKRMESELQKSEQQFRTVFRDAPIGISMVNRHYRFTRVNTAFCRLLGYSEQELAGLTFMDITHPDDRGHNVRLADRMFAGELPGYRLIKRYMKKDGTIVWVHLTATTVKGPAGDTLFGLAMTEDITERKHAEEVQERLVAELAESRNRFEMFFRQTPSAIAITTVKEGRFLDVNKQAEVLTGYSREELIGRTTVEMNLYVDPTDRPKLVQALQEKGVITDLERLIRTKSGEIRTAVFSLVPIQIGSEPCLLSIAHDITERRRAEEALRSNEQMLRTLLTEREQLMQDLHDGIIQSLYAIGMSVDECRRLTDEDPRKAGMKLGQTVGDINGVIRAVRSHLVEGTEDMPFSASRFKAELARVAGTMERANALHFRLKVDPRAAECLTTEERREMLYIAQETMSNCLRHSGASIANISLRLGRDRVVLEVEDDGKGFDTTTLIETNGGLHNVERRAQKIGARVEIVSQREYGTRIRLSMPIHE